jgi:hypothetical protein
VSLGVALDFTKPAKAIVSTRMDVRIATRPAAACCGKATPKAWRAKAGGADDGKMPRG